MGCRKLTLNLIFGIVRCSAFRICITLWGLKWTVWPWKTIFSQKVPKNHPVWQQDFRITWLWRGLAPTILKIMTFFTRVFEKIKKYKKYSNSDLIFVIFLHIEIFLDWIFLHTKVRKSQNWFTTKQRKLPTKKCFPSKQCKMQQNTINCTQNEGDFRFLYICHVKKFEINTCVDKL